MTDLNIIFQIAILLFSVVIHEVSHGAVAYWLGDPTAKYAGRLTLNPIPHLDPVGSILVPFIMSLSGIGIVGWAKPVPYNPYNLRNQRYGPGLVAIAGPVSNLAIAIFFSIFIKILYSAGFIDPIFINFLMYIIFINVLLAVFNLVPIPPLDGSKVLFAFLPDSMYEFKAKLEQYSVFLLLIFIFFLFPLITPIVYWIFNFLV